MNIEAKSGAQREWAQDVLSRMDSKMRYGVKKAQEISGIPYTVAEGQWVPREIHWWTNGFWPAAMWLMYLKTGDKSYEAEALRGESLLDEALKNFEELHHDVGFMWLISSGAHYALTGDEISRKRLIFCAMMLAGRYNLNGFIRAWNQPHQTGWSIIDTMMNLPLLHYASHLTHDPRYKLIGLQHARTAQKAFIRADGSAHHIVAFDPETGAILDTPTGQGYAPGTSWSRGQAWAIYGFTLSFIASGDESFLRTARGVADYFIDHMPQDGIPPIDFLAPEEPVLKDSCAGAIAASGMLEIARQLSDAEGQKYFDAAVKLLKAMDEQASDWTERSPAILTLCSSAYHDIPGRHIAMNYADFFFIEAMQKLVGETRLLWFPDSLVKK